MKPCAAPARTACTAPACGPGATAATGATAAAALACCRMAPFSTSPWIVSFTLSRMLQQGPGGQGSGRGTRERASGGGSRSGSSKAACEVKKQLLVLGTALGPQSQPHASSHARPICMPNSLYKAAHLCGSVQMNAASTSLTFCRPRTRLMQNVSSSFDSGGAGRERGEGGVCVWEARGGGGEGRAQRHAGPAQERARWASETGAQCRAGARQQAARPRLHAARRCLALPSSSQHSFAVEPAPGAPLTQVSLEPVLGRLQVAPAALAPEHRDLRGGGGRGRRGRAWQEAWAGPPQRGPHPRWQQQVRVYQQDTWPAAARPARWPGGMLSRFHAAPKLPPAAAPCTSPDGPPASGCPL